MLLLLKRESLKSEKVYSLNRKLLKSAPGLRPPSNFDNHSDSKVFYWWLILLFVKLYNMLLHNDIDGHGGRERKYTLPGKILIENRNLYYHF